jgi:hypothetical protein
MHQRGPVSSLALIVAIVAPQIASGSPQKQVADPALSMPKPPRPFDIDPYETNNSFSPMYAPRGKLRSVIGYEGGFRGHADDPPNFNKRVVQRSDDKGDCVDESFDRIDRRLSEDTYARSFGTRNAGRTRTTLPAIGSGNSV